MGEDKAFLAKMAIIFAIVAAFIILVPSSTIINDEVGAECSSPCILLP